MSPEPRGCDAHRSEECRHQRRSDFVRTIGEQTRQPDAKNSAIQPTHTFHPIPSDHLLCPFVLGEIGEVVRVKAQVDAEQRLLAYHLSRVSHCPHAGQDPQADEV